MARKITEKAIYNFLRGHAFNLQNTSVILDGDKVKLLLWGNCIAYYDKNEKSVYFSLCGYNTATTRERLNEIQRQNDGEIMEMAGVKSTYYM